MIKKIVMTSLVFFSSAMSEPINFNNIEPSVFGEFHQVKEPEPLPQDSKNIVEEVKVFFDNEYNKLQNKIKELAFSFLGQQYKFGASKDSVKTDCSLYTQNVFSKIGIKLPRSSIEQSTLGVIVPKEELQVGDLLFFRTYRQTVSHVGIYIGDNKMIHASFKNKEVEVETLDKKYYRDRFLFAKRVIEPSS